MFPDSTAAAAGVTVGDIVAGIDNERRDTTDAVIAAVSRHKYGELVRIELVHDGEHRILETALKAQPLEKMANATVSYDSVVAFPGVRLRTITSTPTGPQKRFPAVLLVQGGGCGSIDTPTSPTNPISASPRMWVARWQHPQAISSALWCSRESIRDSGRAAPKPPSLANPAELTANG